MTVTAKVEVITKSKAQKMLGKNTMNRAMTVSKLNTYAEIMRQGEWVLNGETIIIASDETLLNGQHRLNAVIKSGVSVKILVCRGVDKNAFSSIDTGKVRSGKDALTIDGYSAKEAQLLASCARLNIIYSKTGSLHQTASASPFVTPKKILDAIKEDGMYSKSVEFVMKTKSTLPVSASHLSFLAYRFMSINETFSKDWLNGLMTGENLEVDDYRLWARNIFFKDLGALRSMPPINKDLMIIKAWHYSISGIAIKRKDFPQKLNLHLKQIALPSDK